jgi:hypothetical protein
MPAPRKGVKQEVKHIFLLSLRKIIDIRGISKGFRKYDELLKTPKLKWKKSDRSRKGVTTAYRTKN